MYLHYTYFLHDAYTTLTCTTYNYTVIYYNTITLVKLNYSWSIYIIVCMLIVWVTNRNFVC